ncbi:MULTISPECIES: carboxylesterase family protein [unclassified Novosphingobium]|uniref:carboxylesterase/lipase family protein n=1 Tax=unclassified Novosphingobium TaxID=2644732 RepID=UPI00146C529A|nr:MULTISPECIES: carboxylesterase family protein [unclassified Novosphingobium]NMN05215.1 para-nitrobenzyl esterase [Novosphingobium sp. SG919]NMN87510.1 para-nitrobenzyl esterase [Novosphingobium sp. SG916]
MVGATLARREALGLIAAAPLLAHAPGVFAMAMGDGLTIATTGGAVRGKLADGVRVFTGIPYGRAARFAPARPAPRWPGLWDATAPAPVCPQRAGMMPFAGTMSEDCLALNIWAPTAPGRHPVLVYIHGGGNETGWSGEALTAGDRFAADGVVAVTVNYRVGALGFLETGGLLGAAYAGSANNGMRDLVLALRWVRANIAAFGGDPARITIAGESAGGKNVGTLLGMPMADTLYSRAAIFSGGGQTVHTRAEAEAFARVLAEKLGGADKLLTAPTAQLLAAQEAAKAAWPRNFPFRPMVDGQVLPMVPLARLRAGQAPRVPLLIGSNADESRLFIAPQDAAGPIKPQALSNATIEQMTTLDAAYAQAFPELSVPERHWRLLTAEEYGMPCLRLAAAQASHGTPVWRYRLTYPAPGGPFKGHSPHVLDVPFTFDHVNSKGMAQFLGLSATDQPLVNAMHGAMLRFVQGQAPAGPGLPAWHTYDAKAHATMVLDHAPAIASDPDGVERQIWGE